MADTSLNQNPESSEAKWFAGVEPTLDNPAPRTKPWEPETLELARPHAEPGRLIEVKNDDVHAGTTTHDAILGDAFELLQAFDGTVETVTGDDVSVTLRDITDTGRPDEEAVLSLRQFDHPHRVGPGTAFYLTIGYRERRSGRELVTVTRVRTIVPLTTAQRMRAEREARAFRRVLEAEE